MRKRIISITLCLACLISANAQKVKIAAAANLRYVLESIKKNYEAEHEGVELEITFGSSGTLTQQIANGAPFDLFMAADVDFPKKVKELGFAAGEVKTYIYGKVAMWSLSIDVTQGIKTTLLPTVKKIAIADPKKAPYGRNTIATLKNTNLYDAIASRIVWGENISQAAQFAFSGNAEIGFIALSLALAPDMRGKGTYYILPTTICPPIEQAYVLLKNGADNKWAKDFMDYIVSPTCDRLWTEFGYGLIENK